MANRSLLTLDLRNTWFIYLFSACVALLFSGCASIPNMGALENDELYLSRGEEFVTDAQYLAFALETAGYEEESGSDYYDPTRSTQANGMIPGYRPSFMNNQNAMQWGMGLSSGFNPFGFGISNGYDPYMNSGFGYNPNGGMGYGNSGFGYNPYGGYGGYGGYNPYAYGGYNSYGGYNGFNPYGGGYNPYNYGNWTGNDSDQGGSTVTGFTRTPIMSNTAGGSNYNAGLLNRPKDEVVSSNASWSPSNVAPVSDRTPAATNSETTRGANRWLESPSTPLHSPTDLNPSGRTTPERNKTRNRTRATRTSSWGNSQPSTTPPPRNNSNSSARPSNNNNNGSSRSKGTSRPAGTSRSNRGGGH